MAAPVTRNLTILFTDLKGFTDKTSRKSRADLQGLLERHHDLVLPVLEGKGGKLIKTIGDAFLMVFESPTDAVLAGIAVQEALERHNDGKLEDDRIEVRISINLGEVVLAENDVFGEAVNIAARIEGVAVPGEVFFTEAVYLAMNKAEVPTSEVGLLQLKGIPEKIRAYKVRREQPVEGHPASGKRTVWDRLRAAPATLAPSDKARLAGSAGAAAGLGRRAGAFLLDLVLVGMLVGFVAGSGRRDPVKVRTAQGPGGLSVQAGGTKVEVGADRVDVSQDDEGDGHPSKRLFPLFWFLYGLLFTKRLRATPGMKVFGLVVASTDGRPLESGQVWARGLFSLLSGGLAGVGYLWALFRSDRRTWHDLVADTVVRDAA